MNGHVLVWIRFNLFLATKYKRHLAQLSWYTQYMLELDPEWKPEHMR
jgi:hypothetical protein